MKRLILPLLMLALCVCVQPAFAAGFDVDDAFSKLAQFSTAMKNGVDTALSSGAVTQVVNVLFMALATILFVWKFVGYALRGFDMLDILELMMTILFVYMLLKSYTIIFPTIYGGAQYIGSAIGNGISGLADGSTMAQNLMRQFANMSFKPDCDGLDCLGSKFPALIATIIIWVAVLVLGILAMITQVWITWGVLIAYAIGWVMIPFMLYERLHFLCDGWLKFFFGMLVYGLVANANLALVYLAITKFMGAGLKDSGAAVDPMPIGNLSEAAGLLVFVFIGIFALAATSRFAQAIVMGAGGGGIGGIAQGAARAGANAASAGAGALAGAIKR
jgi:hypothetical protein